MRRREFIAGLGSAAWPVVARAQQPPVPVIGWLDAQPGGPTPEFVEGFRRGLAEVGLSVGRDDVTVEYYLADGHPERLSALASDLVRRRPAAIVALQGFAASVAKEATRDIPVIFINATDPVEFGLVASLNRPGGNLTGVTILGGEIAQKRLELLHKAVPAAETIALLLVGRADAPVTQVENRSMQSAARILGLRLLVFNVAIDTEIAPIFATLVEHQIGAIVVGGGVNVYAKRDQILSLAARYVLPTMFAGSDSTRAGVF
jgi:putative tryptophan/tyrosine transport system substrate-binding protein